MDVIEQERPPLLWTPSAGSSSSATGSTLARVGGAIATRVARALAEHAFALGVQRVAAYVNVGNLESERVLERAGFTREGVVRSMPKPDRYLRTSIQPDAGRRGLRD